MTENTTPNSDLATIMHTLGHMQGESRAQFASIFDHLSLIRDEIKKAEERSQERITHLEESIKDKITFVERRVSNLEVSDKKQAVAIAKHSIIGGSISGAFISATVEFIKWAINN
jgi:hypothetical protein